MNVYGLLAVLLAWWVLTKTKEGYSRGCPQGMVWDPSLKKCRWPSMRASLDGGECGPGLEWDPVEGNCNTPKYLRNRGRACINGKVWDGTKCRYPGMEASGVVCPEGMTWNTAAGQCEYTNVLLGW